MKKGLGGDECETDILEDWRKVSGGEWRVTSGGWHRVGVERDRMLPQHSIDLLALKLAS
jgi:hypothetical protein